MPLALPYIEFYKNFNFILSLSCSRSHTLITVVISLFLPGVQSELYRLTWFQNNNNNKKKMIELLKEQQRRRRKKRKKSLSTHIFCTKTTSFELLPCCNTLLFVLLLTLLFLHSTQQFFPFKIVFFLCTAHISSSFWWNRQSILMGEWDESEFVAKFFWWNCNWGWSSFLLRNLSGKICCRNRFLLMEWTIFGRYGNY